MDWRSGERTLATYEHLQRRARFFEQLQDIHKAMKRRKRDSNRKESVTVSSIVEDRKTVVRDRDLDFLLGEDHELSKSA
jgi:hypothetical protein